MRSKRKFIMAIHLILYSNDWVVFMDSKRYPFVIYRKKGVDKELKVPRAETLNYDGAYDLLTIIITTLNEQFGIKEIKEEAFSGWSEVESVFVDEALKKENHFHIGTQVMGILDELADRDMPKKVKIGTSKHFKFPICPNCKTELNEYYKYANKFCKECGQRLDWGNENDK